MRRALFTIVLTTGIFASATTPAHTIPTKLKPEASAALKLESRSELIKISTQNRSAIAPTAPRNPAQSHSGKDDSGWKYAATLLTTLALIGAIAVRRHKPGRS